MNKILLPIFLLIISYGRAQQIDIQTRNNASEIGANVKSGFFQTSSPVNFPLGATNGEWWYLLDTRHGDPRYAMQLSGSFWDQNLWFRKITEQNNLQAWSKILMEDQQGNSTIGQSGGIINIPARLSITNDVNVAGSINANHVSVGGFVLNDNSSHSTMRIGKDMHDNIIADNSPEKHYGGGYFFRVHSPTESYGYADVMMFSEDGNVGIGIKPKNKLDVNGTIHAREVKVDLQGWADYVFKKDYVLPTLEEVEKHIKEKGYLPDVPSEKEVLEKGINLGDNQRLLLQKIEELTLYTIEQNKLNKEQTELLKSQSEKIKDLESRLNSK